MDNPIHAVPHDNQRSIELPAGASVKISLPYRWFTGDERAALSNQGNFGAGICMPLATSSIRNLNELIDECSSVDGTTGPGTVRGRRQPDYEYEE
jgi:hypothetical protein